MVSVRGLLFPALLLASLPSYWHLASAQASGPLSLTDLFEVSFDTLKPGNCKANADDLNNILADAYTLAQAGLQGVLDSTDKTATTYDEAVRLVGNLFFNPSQAEWDIVRRRFKAVRQWLERGDAILHGKSNNKPYLYCSDSWRIREDMSTQMRDPDGNLMDITFKEDDYMKQRQKTVAKQLGAAKSRIYPYWCPGIKAYIFDKYYDSDPELGPCSTESDLLGYTVYEIKQGLGVITLCPKAFEGGRLRSATVNTIPDTEFKNNKPLPAQDTTEIKAVAPQATTFYHELFHLLWTDQMYPDNGEEYLFSRMTAKRTRKDKNNNDVYYTKADAMKNPQNYVYTAIAYDYTQNERAQPNENDEMTHPIEFYTGWATFKD